MLQSAGCLFVGAAGLGSATVEFGCLYGHMAQRPGLTGQHRRETSRRQCIGPEKAIGGKPGRHQAIVDHGESLRGAGGTLLG
jgi:hypothetical protein